ncbi:cysteine synthase family protein [Patescibacteria group bacterium]|nr:cysteine synthase family protein [Patescibacteria group bacterium]
MLEILDLIGSTPVVQILRLTTNPNVKIFAKLEGQNIGGSVKDRIAKQMIEQAEKKGELTKEKTILESTSGNTGIALAMIAAIKGYEITLTMPASMSEERKKILKAYGATLIQTPPENGTGGAIEEARRLVAENPDTYWMPNQHNTLENPAAHHATTAQEILSQVPKITHFVGGMGTFGTLRGVSTNFKEKNLDIKIIGVEPVLGERIDGLRSMQEPNPPGIFDESYLDKKLLAMRSDAVEMARKIAKTNGLLVGVSSGAALWGAAILAEELQSGIIVTILPDRGEKYLSTDLFE